MSNFPGVGGEMKGLYFDKDVNNPGSNTPAESREALSQTFDEIAVRLNNQDEYPYARLFRSQEGVPSVILVPGPIESGDDKPSSYALLTSDGRAYDIRHGGNKSYDSMSWVNNMMYNNPDRIVAKLANLNFNANEPVIYLNDKGLKADELHKNVSLYVGVNAMQISQRGEAPFKISQLNNEQFGESLLKAKEASKAARIQVESRIKVAFSETVEECRTLGDQSYGRIINDNDGYPTVVIFEGSNQADAFGAYTPTKILTKSGLRILEPQVTILTNELSGGTDDVFNAGAELSKALQRDDLLADLVTELGATELSLHVAQFGEVQFVLPISGTNSHWHFAGGKREHIKDLDKIKAEATKFVESTKPFVQPDRLNLQVEGKSASMLILESAGERNRLAKQHGCQPFALFETNEEPRSFILAAKPLEDGLIIYSSEHASFLRIPAEAFQKTFGETSYYDAEIEKILALFQDSLTGQLISREFNSAESGVDKSIQPLNIEIRDFDVTFFDLVLKAAPVAKEQLLPLIAQAKQIASTPVPKIKTADELAAEERALAEDEREKQARDLLDII